MAVEGRIPVRHEDVFLVPVTVLSVDPVEDYEKRKAGAQDPQERDKTTGMRLWSVSVMDVSAPKGKREIGVKIAADHQPVPPLGIGHPAEFDGLQVIPWLDDLRSRARVSIAYRASGFRQAKQQRAAA